MAKAEAVCENGTIQISLREWQWINERLIDLEVRLTLATAWMREMGATGREVEIMGID